MSRGGESARSTGDRRGPVALAAAALVLLAVLPYVGALGHPLLHDDRTLLDSAWLRDAGLAEIFASDYWHGTRHAGSDLYRPVTVATLAWSMRTARSPVAFRVLALALHAWVVLLVWWVLDRTLRSLEGETAGDGHGGPGRSAGGLVAVVLSPAWVGAALFAAHPLASEAVLFAVGRAEILAAGFGLLGFGLLIDSRGRDGLRVTGSAISFGLAFLSKESAAVWILILALWWLVARGARRDPGRAAKGVATWLAVLVPLLIARAVVVGWRPHRPPWVDNPLVLEGPVGRALNAIRVHAIYLGKMTFPARLSVDYGFDQIEVWPVFPWGVGVALIVVAAWVALAVVLRRISAAALFLWALVPVAFAVTGNFAFPIGTIFAERLAYLPLVGFCGLVGYLIPRLSPSRGTLALIVLLAISPAVLRTVARTGDLRDHGTFVESTAAASPRAVKALTNVGRSRLRAGRVAEAREPLERAVTIWPDYRRALELLADVTAEMGDAEAAATYRERAEAAAARTQAETGPPPSP